MVSRYLVTTALEETWPNSNENVIFLGEWCLLHTKKSIWKNLNAVIEPYHWDNRKKLHNDYLNLKTLYEDLLVRLSYKLNEVHQVNRSLRYWRILVGPWLGYFTQIVFDRWEMLRQVDRNNKIHGVKVVQANLDGYIPTDMNHFNQLIMGDAWNEMIYGQILQYMKIPIEPIALKNQTLVISKKPTLVKRFKKRLLQSINALSSKLSHSNEYFFLHTCMPLLSEFCLQLKLKQFPKLWRSGALPSVEINNDLRAWSVFEGDEPKEYCFSAFLDHLVSKHIPICYLEGYEKAIEVVDKHPWPKAPKAIWTSLAYEYDDFFKFWAASRVEQGSLLLVGQHGGNYGMALWSYSEDHQIEIADYFFSWGWSRSDTNKIIPIGNFKDIGKKVTPQKNGGLVMVSMELPRQSYQMYSVPVSCTQMKAYLEDQFCFVRALPDNFQDRLTVRLMRDQGYLNYHKLKWRDEFPKIKLDDGFRPIDKVMSGARIYIGTYNATGYLEALAFNFPTIIFWNTKHWEIREDSIPFFSQLEKVGIFHKTPESAAKKIASVWDDIDLWWRSEAVQSARENFINSYTKMPHNMIDVLKNTIESQINKK